MTDSALPCQLDLRAHTASHPRMGVVDHIAVHPLLHGGAQPTAADVASGAALATATAQALAAAPLWVPVYMYGAASPTGDVALADVRRRLGYFTPSKGGTTSIWGLGDADTDTSSVLQPPPEYGPPVAHPTAGVACVGALPRWVTNFNLVLTWAGDGKGAQHGDQAALLVEARAVAMAVSARRGGPAGCQSMALGRHVGEEAAGSDAQSQNEVEVACNVLAPPAGPSLDTVTSLVVAAAQSRGLRVVRQYCTNVEPHQLRDLALARDRTPMPGS